MTKLPSNRTEVEAYVITMLESFYVSLMQTVTLDATFDELRRSSNHDYSGIDLTLNVENDLGIEISDSEAESIDQGTVSELVDLIVEKLDL